MFYSGRYGELVYSRVYGELFFRLLFHGKFINNASNIRIPDLVKHAVTPV